MKKITLPPGFKIEMYAEKVPNARSMTLSPSGVLFVGTRKKGEIYAVIDEDKEMFPEECHHQIFIAKNGSWNRSKKIGYRISYQEPKDN